jgi:hypothetical protein
MNDAKYIGLDVHQATISVAILDSAGKLVMEAILETKAETILQFVGGLRGSLQVTFEEGTCAAWLHDLLTWHKYWFATRAKIIWGKLGTRTIAMMHANWPNCCTGASLSRSITAKTACEL